MDPSEPHTAPLPPPVQEDDEWGAKAKGKAPSDKELRDAICEILDDVDFNTTTFNDILKLLAKRYEMDLAPRKSSIKVMIKEEAMRLADEAEEEAMAVTY